jgi:RNA-directed DNA polymerase
MSKSATKKKRKARAKRAAQSEIAARSGGARASDARGRRFTEEQKQHALTLVVSQMKREKIAGVIGTTTESLRRWVREAEANGSMPRPPVVSASSDESTANGSAAGGRDTTAATSIYAPKDPGSGLADYEEAAILELKREHPSYGPAQIRAQLKRFKGWRIANKAIARVLKKHGYELVHRKGRPQGPEPIRFEAPHRNALWQMDFAEMRVGGDKLHLLLVIDDFSRYLVAHELGDSPSGEVAVRVLRNAIARHGKPEAVRTDRGGGFTGRELTQALEAELIDHIVGHAYHPQGGGKVESLVGTVRRELWDVEHFADRSEAQRRLDAFVIEYNERRAHMGIDGLTPADRYFGRADRVLAALNALSRKRNGAFGQLASSGAPLEDVLDDGAGAPMEVLRLVIVEGQMELRLCGARVRLGPVEGV